jgi:hypothetical protein
MSVTDTKSQSRTINGGETKTVVTNMNDDPRGSIVQSCVL